MRSDVPLAFCMSGGVDSVALISIAKKVFDAMWKGDGDADSIIENQGLGTPPPATT